MIGCLIWPVAVVIAGLLSLIPTAGPYLGVALLVGTAALHWWLRTVIDSPPSVSESSPDPTPVSRGGGPAQGGSVRFTAEEAMPVVGTGYRQHDWGSKRGLGTVQLTREPNNSHDGNALKVMFGGRHIGYIPRERAALLAPAMDHAGHRSVEAAAKFSDRGVMVTAPRSLQPAMDPIGSWKQLRFTRPWGRCNTTFEVEFEADHRDEVAEVFRAEGVALTSEGSVLMGVPALIAPSRHPAGAAVLIYGHWVGNILGPDFSPYAAAIRQLAERGRLIEAKARLWGRNDHGVIRSSVRISMPDLNQMEPPGPLPTGAHVVLPPGRAIQVTGEERYLDELNGLLDGAPDRPVVAELYRLTKPGRTVKVVVGVRVYGDEVGELTPTTSAHFLPLLEACEEEGITVVCRAVVKGNLLKADVVLDATKAGELSNEWIAENVYGSAARSPEGDGEGAMPRQ